MTPLIIGEGRVGKTIHQLTRWPIEDKPENIKGAEAVVNCTPDPKLYAEMALKERIPFYDISGLTKECLEIEKQFKDANLFCMTGLGLAPGLINILAYQLLERFSRIDDPKFLHLYCGGIPINCSNWLKHSTTWSEESLVENYIKNLEIIHLGRRISVVPLTGKEVIQFDRRDYEAFYTYGGLDETLKEAERFRLNSCFYKTIRLPGHRDIASGILNIDCGKETLTKILKFYRTTFDEVLIRIDVGNNELKLNTDIRISSTGLHTAMQRATAIPVIASIKASRGHINTKSMKTQDFNIFNDVLKENGLNLWDEKLTSKSSRVY